LIDSAAAASALSFTSARERMAPRTARCLASASAMPEAAPVMAITLPAKGWVDAMVLAVSVGMLMRRVVLEVDEVMRKGSVGGIGIRVESGSFALMKWYSRLGCETAFLRRNEMGR